MCAPLSQVYDFFGKSLQAQTFDAIAEAQLLNEAKPWFILIPSGRWRDLLRLLLLLGATAQAYRIPFELAFYGGKWSPRVCTYFRRP